MSTPITTVSNFEKSLEIRLDMSEVLATCGCVPASLAGALSARSFDLLSHHRKAVIKNAKTWPGGAKAQRAVASRLFRYGSKNGEQASAISDVQGQSFAASTSEPSSPFAGGSLGKLESGGTVSTNQPMIVPIARGLNNDGLTKSRMFINAIKNHTFDVITQGKGRGLVILQHAANNKDQNDEKFRGWRSVVIGKLLKSRRQSPMLRFFESFERIVPKHKADMEKDLGDALTAAGLAKLDRRADVQAAQRGAYRAAYAEALANLPGKHAKARAAGAAAAKLVRARSLQDGAGGGA